MSTNIRKIYEDLDTLNISERSGMLERLQTEQCFCKIMSGLRNELMEKCIPLAIFNELWSWYCGGTEDGVWQYYEHSINVALIDDTAGVLQKYGCDEFAEQYINAGKELMPLMTGELPYEEADLINEISERYGNYISSHANEICMVIKAYLLDYKSDICDAFNDVIIIDTEDCSVLIPEGGFDFSDMLSNPYLGEEQRADIAAALAKFNEMASAQNGRANIFNIEKRNNE